MKTALIIGSSGLIGKQLLNNLLESSDYVKVIAFNKRDLGLNHPKLEQHLIDFDNISSYENLIKGDDFFCTIGTTIKKAGSKDAFKKVDFTYPQQFAKIAKTNNIKHFLIVSSIGSDAKSSNFYIKTKGEIENFLTECNFESLSIFRPSVLTGDRDEFRLGEKYGAFIMNLFSFLLIGSLKKYKPIKSQTVAKAMYFVAQKDKLGVSIYESDMIHKF